MSAPGTQDEVGLSHVPKEMALEFQIPTVPSGGTNRDMGTLALFLIANWFVNGETVLIDGGVSHQLELGHGGSHTYCNLSDRSSSSTLHPTK